MIYKGDTNVLGIHLPAFDTVAINYFSIDYYFFAMIILKKGTLIQ
jgi:hypothetical protein